MKKYLHAAKRQVTTYKLVYLIDSPTDLTLIQRRSCSSNRGGIAVSISRLFYIQKWKGANEIRDPIASEKVFSM